MKDYHINIFFSEEDDCYIADIPDLAMCSACGKTPEEALREAESPRLPGSSRQGRRQTDSPSPVSPCYISSRLRVRPERRVCRATQPRRSRDTD